MSKMDYARVKNNCIYILDIDSFVAKARRRKFPGYELYFSDDFKGIITAQHLYFMPELVDAIISPTKEHGYVDFSSVTARRVFIDSVNAGHFKIMDNQYLKKRLIDCAEYSYEFLLRLNDIAMNAFMYYIMIPILKDDIYDSAGNLWTLYALKDRYKCIDVILRGYCRTLYGIKNDIPAHLMNMYIFTTPLETVLKHENSAKWFVEFILPWLYSTLSKDDSLVKQINEMAPKWLPYVNITRSPLYTKSDLMLKHPRPYKMIAKSVFLTNPALYKSGYTTKQRKALRLY